MRKVKHKKEIWVYDYNIIHVIYVNILLHFQEGTCKYRGNSIGLRDRVFGVII